jgi:MFS family permease
MEFPSLWLMTKIPIGKYVGSCLVLWGALLCFFALCHNFAGVATIRFLLGVFEAAILPCMMIINSMWYLRNEQPLRTALWNNTFAGVFGGILSYAIGKIEGSLSTWKVRSQSLAALLSQMLMPLAVYLPHLWSMHCPSWLSCLRRSTRHSISSMVLHR